MNSQEFFLNQNWSLFLVLLVSVIFAIIGINYSKKYRGLNNYLIANRSVNVISLSTSLIVSALGAWILFGPASAATWGGIGSVIGYSLGTAFPMLALIYLGTKLRKIFSKGISLTEFIRIKFGTNLFKLITFLTIFYMFIFLCAEVTGISILVKYVSNTPLWITASIVIITTLSYTLYGGLKVSIFTDNIQFFIIILFLLISINYIFLFTDNNFSFDIIRKNAPHLINSKYIPNYTSGLTFFIAVAATNLFHQGNWQRVFSAKNEKVLKKSLLISFIVIIPIVFFMGFSGLVAISQNSNVNPDLAFFSILLKNNSEIISVVVIVLALSLTISTLDTLVNAISSIFIINGKNLLKKRYKIDYLKLSKYLMIFLCIITFFIASKGFSILYLFLLADLLCCSAVFTVFYSFYSKKINSKTAMLSILLGLFFGLMLFPSPDFSQSILVGGLLSFDLFPEIISSSLLFCSFLLATFVPVIVITNYDTIKKQPLKKR